jgi:acyl dehydratase
MMIDIDVRAIRDHTGQELAVGEWITIAQSHIDRFAEATGDDQWIHTDPIRARAESPFKTTVAHGFLTLSLLTALLRSAVRITGTRLAINYGLNRVRFLAPVPAGAKVRGRFAPGVVEDVGDHGVQVTWQATIERDGAAKPCCVAEWIVRYYVEKG